MNRKLLLLVAVFLPALAQTLGCTPVHGTTAYFYDNVPPGKHTTVSIIPLGDQGVSLEWDVYRQQLEKGMVKAGIELAESHAAEYVVTFMYSIDGQGETTTRAVPLYNSNTGRMTGVVNTTQTVHQRILVVRFYPRGTQVSQSSKPAVEIRVLSGGSSSELARVMPVLTKMAFKRWPGRQGKVYEWTESL